MRLARYAMYLWPGLPDLWWRGSPVGFALALGFATALNLVVAATWVWDSLLGPGRTGILWAGLIAVWIGLLLVSLRRAIRADFAARLPDTFATALAEYLRGNWLEAETHVRQLLAKHPADVEAALLLATVQRHTLRIDEARATLDELVRWDGAEAWQMEIDQEYRQLTEKELTMATAVEQEVHTHGNDDPALPNLHQAA